MRDTACMAIGWFSRIDRLHRTLDAQTEDALARHMHFPGDWDPFFRDQ